MYGLPSGLSLYDCHAGWAASYPPVHSASCQSWPGSARGWAAFVVDDLVSVDPWTLRFLEIRGRAEAIPTGGGQLGRGFGEAFIRIYPEKINSFGIED